MQTNIDKAIRSLQLKVGFDDKQIIDELKINTQAFAFLSNDKQDFIRRYLKHFVCLNEFGQWIPISQLQYNSVIKLDPDFKQFRCPHCNKLIEDN